MLRECIAEYLHPFPLKVRTKPVLVQAETVPSIVRWMRNSRKINYKVYLVRYASLLALFVKAVDMEGRECEMRGTF